MASGVHWPISACNTWIVLFFVASTWNDSVNAQTVTMCTSSQYHSRKGYIQTAHYPDPVRNEPYTCQCVINAKASMVTVNILFSGGSLCSSTDICQEEMKLFTTESGIVFDSCQPAMCLAPNTTLTELQVDVEDKKIYVAFTKYYDPQKTQHGSFKLLISGSDVLEVSCSDNRMATLPTPMSVRDTGVRPVVIAGIAIAVLVIIATISVIALILIRRHQLHEKHKRDTTTARMDNNLAVSSAVNTRTENTYSVMLHMGNSAYPPQNQPVNAHSLNNPLYDEYLATSPPPKYQDVVASRQNDDSDESVFIVDNTNYVSA